MAGATGKSRRSANTIAAIVLVAAILILVNIILAGVPLRLDLTEGREFTISRATRDALGDLKDLVTVTVYMSEDLPPQLSTLRRQISDLLDEYRNYGHGRVQIDFVDPGKDPETEQRLRTLGIPQITAQTVQQDQLQVINIYLGLLVSYLDRQEVIPVVQDTYTLEYDLTSAILKVSRQDDYVVGFLAGPTVHDPSRQLTGLRDLLQKQFEVRIVNLGAGDEPVPEDVDLLVVAGPSEVPDAIQYQLDQFLMRGGRMICLVDAIRLPEGGGLQAFPLDSGIEDLLAHYGVRVQQALVVDRALNAPASFSGGFMRYTMPYPYWPKAVPDLLNSVNPVTNRLESLVFPWVAPLELDVPIGPGDPLEKIAKLTEADRQAREELARRMGVSLPPEEESAPATAGTSTAAGEAGGSGIMASVLARTSPRAWTVSGRYDLNPQQNFPPGQMAAQILAAALSGRFPSYYQNHEVPAATPAAGIEGAPAEPQPMQLPILESPETRLLVVGNALFATDGFLGQFPENSLFLLNAIDWMTVGDRLISIRSRGATDRPLKQISDGTKSTIKLLVILGAPLIVIALGLVRFTLRRRAWNAQEIAVREV
jgi:ABC-2 type transport system permease protein